MTSPAVTTFPSRPELLTVGPLLALRAAKDPVFYRLKRGTELLDAMLEPVFHQVKAQLRANRVFWISDESLACALLLVARLDETPGTTPLVRKLAGKTVKDPHRYSDLRFAGLIRSDEPAELFQNLQRAIAYCKARVEPFDLVRTVFGWSGDALPSTRKRLIAQFHFFA